MGWRVLLSEDAERDIEDLCRFIARRDGAETAERILGEIEAAAMSLEEFPERGNIPKELVSIGIGDYREIHHKPWRMIYRIMGSDVVIYCVVDGRRDMQSFLERRLLR
ncbi:type II toxin-antitoxin system RelE/ParE family toxin [Shinella sp.]|uniref:type II toxin-antitoxin system RelE/ParE family toxin n=1 Tax=Shinella sp. TaxID=1870904 RepID=UPI002589DD02|nr:type II toxin-antitoxin system RelE/ParE family toxin [Shinella sp.]MCW5711083.1 type II toxin-antitoxin system RelE/ParE family toxin [Shinella sp.]